jgi:methylated-DNA-[protein]-cysteine S-methyltransferase
MVEVLFDSPLGPLTLVTNGTAITALEWRHPTPALAVESDALTDTAVKQLTAYFTGHDIAFELPLQPAGSPLVSQVCAAMQEIPYGQTTSYGAIAAKIGSVPRAVGGACGRNPIPIIIPCHRVLGSTGRLTGFSGLGGVATKKWLLALERGEPTLI